jgi:large subunit ribosomal protein L18
MKRHIIGTKERPRLSVKKSSNNFYAQVIDDQKGMTIASASTYKLDNKKKNKGNITFAKMVGKNVAEKAIAKGVKKVVFDRGTQRYSGSIKALADAAREGGLEF